MEPDPGIFRAHFDCIEEVAESLPWELDFRQLDPGTLDASVQITQTRTILIGEYQWNRAFHQQGRPPADGLTFGLVDGRSNVRWAGQAAGPGKLLDFNGHSGFDGYSGRSFSGCSLTVDPQKLAMISDVAGCGMYEPGRRAFNGVLESGPSQFESLVNSVRKIHSFLSHPHQDKPATELMMDLESDLYVALARLVEPNGGFERSQLSNRQKALRRALDHINSQPRQPITVAQLCQACSVSHRTLVRAFAETLACTPKQYLKQVRLQGAFRELRLAPPDTEISRVALNWGFWHMSQFARDFWRQFGELPSQTRNRSLN